MNLQEHLQSLMLKTAKDFDVAASTEPTINSEEAGTFQSADLDEVLAYQKVERESLWKELHHLEERQRALNGNHVFADSTDSNRKRLMMLQWEEIELNREREKQENDIASAPLNDDDIIRDLEFKERLQRSVKELTQLVSFLKGQLTDTSASYQRELSNLDECQQVQNVLTAKIQEIETGGVLPAAVRLRQKQMKARLQYQDVMENLMDFLEDYYPPHLVDGADPFDNNPENMCDMKYILEDLMNRAVLNPSNPYIELKNGTYWSPFIETLVKGNVARRHPKNAQRLKLVDFLIH